MQRRYGDMGRMFDEVHIVELETPEDSPNTWTYSISPDDRRTLSGIHILGDTSHGQSLFAVLQRDLCLRVTRLDEPNAQFSDGEFKYAVVGPPKPERVLSVWKSRVAEPFHF